MPPTDSNLPGPEDRPPYAVLDMTVSGYLQTDDPGELIIETGETMVTTMVIDGHEVERAGPSRHQVTLERGRHFIQIKSRLSGNRWTFVPLWNGSPIGATGFAVATTSIPSASDARIRGPLSSLTQILAAAIVIGWIATFVWSWLGVTIGLQHGGVGNPRMARHAAARFRDDAARIVVHYRAWTRRCCSRCRSRNKRSKAPLC